MNNKTRKQQKQKKQKQKKQKQIAGKFIKEGSYGCVFRPAIHCDTNSNITPDSISKVMDKVEAQIEYDIGQNVAKIDADQQYTLYPKRLCNLKKPWSIRNNTYKCKAIQTKDVAQLIYTDGGYDLTSVIERIKSMNFSIHIKFFNAFQNVLEGIKKLHTHNFVHMDLKSDNIICSLTGSENSWFRRGKPTYNMRLIDFGLSDYISNIISEDNNNFLRTYYIWPYELRLIHSQYRHKQPKFSDFEDYKIYIRSVVIRGEKIKCHPYWIMDEHSRDTPAIDLYIDINNSINTGKDKEIIPEILKKTDIYSLGITLSYIYSYLTNHYLLENNKITFNKKTQPLHDTLSVPIYELIKKMVHPDYRKRSTIDDVIAEYKQIFSIFFSKLDYSI